MVPATHNVARPGAVVGAVRTSGIWHTLSPALCRVPTGVEPDNFVFISSETVLEHFNGDCRDFPNWVRLLIVQLSGRVRKKLTE